MTQVAKLRVGLVFGGKSGEHEVSLRSADSIRNNLDKNKYQVIDIKVDKNNNFDQGLLRNIDVVFPIIHGTYGEDGCLQGLLEMMDKSYVGAGVLGSAIGMDKDVQKRLLMQAGIPVAKYKAIKRGGTVKISNFPVFVKPANTGSSVGINKCKSKSEVNKAIETAFMYDTKVIIEEEVKGRELEVSVLGNDNPIASVMGEVIPKGKHEFYDYDAKYIDENGAELISPAVLPKNKIREIQKLAVETYKILECSGMARVDMFLTPKGKLVINEINTLPGFTSISMYPRLWGESGISYPELLKRLINLAVEKKKEKDKLKRSY
jgi:D-alanine-D-alanine ligase